MSSMCFRTYGRPRRNHAAALNVSKPSRVKPSYWSDEDSPKVLRKTPDPFDLLLQDEIQKSDEVFTQLSSRLSPNPSNNLSDTSCSPMTPFVNKRKSKSTKKVSKCEYKTYTEEDSENSHNEDAPKKRGFRACRKIVTTSAKKFSKRKRKIKKRPPIFKNSEKENQSDLDNFELLVKAVEKKDNSFDAKILQSVKKSLIYQKNKQSDEKLLNTILQEIVENNVSSEISQINRMNLNSNSSLTVLENSIKEYIVKNDVPISSTPRRTIFDGHEGENNISMIPISITSKLDTSDNKRPIESVSKPDFCLEDPIASHTHSTDIFNDLSKADESFEMLRCESPNVKLDNSNIKLETKLYSSIRIQENFDDLNEDQTEVKHCTSADSIKKNIVNNETSEENLPEVIQVIDSSSDNLSYLDQNLSAYEVNRGSSECSEIKTNNIGDLVSERKRSDFNLNRCSNSIEDPHVQENLDTSKNEFTSKDFLQKLVHCDTITMRKTSIVYISDDDDSLVNVEISRSLTEDESKIENLEKSQYLDENMMKNLEKSHFGDENVTIKNNDKSSFDENVTIQNIEIEDITIENCEKSCFINETVAFENLNRSQSIDENVTIANSEKSLSAVDQSATMKDTERSIMLLPGKKWERSLKILKNLNMTNVTIDQLDCTLKSDNVLKGRKYREGVEKVYHLQNASVLNNSTFSSDATFVREGRRVVVKRALDSICEKTPKSKELLLDPGNGTGALSRSRLSISRFEDDPSLIGRGDCPEDADDDAKSVVLRKCKQYEPIPFDECYPDWKLQKCHKIGEGVYGEVYLIKKEDDPNNPIVMKVIPVEGDQLVNGERQKRYKEILSEITIATELSDLRFNETSKTSTFNKVHDVRLVRGAYPKRLKESWEEFDELKGSENDYPSYFDDQLYIVLELENGGRDIEAFEFWNAKQSYALFFQVVYALAVAEETLQFEHRDLHWGNILVKPSNDEIVKFTISGVPYSVPSCGIFANIIDYTLSRISIPKVGWVIYNDLSDEDLFCSYGDYQFDIYRLMKDEVGNSWELFKPYTNILWLHYLLLKMINGLRYQKKTTKVHKLFLGKIQKLADKILDYESCLDFVQFEKCEI